MAWDDGLSGRALAVAGCDHTPLRVIAGPGTGKTFATKRWVSRVLESGAAADRILAITFTRTAAADLVNELGNLGVEGCEQIEARTLHSYCFSLLNREEVFEFLDRRPRPLIAFKDFGVLRFEAEPLMEDLNNKAVFGGKRERTKRILAFEAAWARLQSDEPGWVQSATDRQFETALNRWLKFHQAILVGELVPLALCYLRDNPASPELGRFEHVVVDEYQDLNKAEQVLIDLLSGNARRVIVGDRDQSIYSFRHANPDGIVEYNSTHPGTHDEPLTECRRCPTSVVAIADHLIRYNHPAGTAPRLTPSPNKPEGVVKIVQWATLNEEATGIADFVRRLTDSAEYEPQDVMILSPRRKIAYAIRDAMVERGIPVHSFYHEEMLEGDATQRSFALLALAVNQEDRVALRYWLGYGSPSWRTGAYARLMTHCEKTGESPWEALTRIESGDLEMKGIAELKKRFKQLVEELAAINGTAGTFLIDYLFPEEQEEHAVVRESAELAGLEAATPADIYESLTSVITQPAMPEAGEYARIMSLHKSKGLTSKVVVVAGCIQGLIPYLEKDWTPEELEFNTQEQRRLFYVALTRATDILVVSSFLKMERKLAYKIGARVRPGYEPIARTIASQFLGELGPTASRPEIGSEWAQRNFS